MIYFMRLKVADSPIKIGVTRGDPASRLIAFRFLPWDAEIIGTVDGDRKHERWVHHMLMEHRIRGEWFKPCAEVTAMMERVLSPGWEWPKKMAAPAWRSVRVGEQVWKAKLDAEKVRAIRADPRPTREIAEAYKVTRPVINRIKNRVAWAHVD